MLFVRCELSLPGNSLPKSWEESKRAIAKLTSFLKFDQWCLPCFEHVCLDQCSPKPRHFLGRRKTKASDIRHFKTCRKFLSCKKRNVPITLNVNVRIATDHGKKRIIKGRLSLEIFSSNYFLGRRLHVCCRSSLYHQSFTINLIRG